MHKETGHGNKSFRYNDPDENASLALSEGGGGLTLLEQGSLAVTGRAANGVQRTREQGVDTRKNPGAGHHSALYGVTKALFWKVQSP